MLKVRCILLFVVFAIAFRLSEGSYGVEFYGKGGFLKATNIDLDNVNFSFEVWVNVSTWPPPDHGWNDARMIWAFMHAGPCSYHQCLLLGFNQTGHACFSFILNDLWAGPFPDDAGKFVHWAGTYHRESGERYLYRNGEIVGRNIAIAPYKPMSKDLFVGQDNVGGNKFLGVVDDFRIWRDVVLSQDIIKRHMFDVDLGGHPYVDNLAVRLYLAEPERQQTFLDQSGRGVLFNAHGIPTTANFAPGRPLPVKPHVATEASPPEAPSGHPSPVAATSHSSNKKHLLIAALLLICAAAVWYIKKGRREHGIPKYVE